MVNYLQYISSLQQSGQIIPNNRFLVSGLDRYVRRTICEQITSTCHSRGKTLFIVDNTQHDTGTTRFNEYRVVNILDGEVSLCDDLLDMTSLRTVSRLRSLLSELGFDSCRAMKVINYLSFVKETERLLGNSGMLSAETLEEYGGTALVMWKLSQLVDRGVLTSVNYLFKG